MAMQPKKRPAFADSTPSSFQALVEQCWAAVQEQRPTMVEIEARLRSGKVRRFVVSNAVVCVSAH
eukprot:COSAG01_NODE_423_length_17260_cov_203.736962_10_plen_65_part_00